jgi:hypothetical protein
MAGAAHAQSERPALRLLERGVRIEPARVAAAALERGEVVRVGPWQAYGAARDSHAPCGDQRVFECYGDSDFDGAPDDSVCGLGSTRWWFGSAYCSGFATNDMTVAPDTFLGQGAWRADVAWNWTCGGTLTEQCVLGVFTQTSDPTLCEADSFDLSGWIFDFGELECNTGGYYYNALDISAIGRWELPPSGKGSYAVMFLTDDGDALASCAQPMLWGSPNNGGDPNGPGAQFTEQIDDDNPRDSVHDVPTECYTYSFGVCPDPLGAMAQFWGERANPPGSRADFNGDTFIDSRDVLAFLAAWNACGAGADCDEDGRCTSLDVLCFLDTWVECRGY